MAMISRTDFTRLAIRFYGPATLLIGLALACLPLWAGPLPWAGLNPVVVIDPGHGGGDSGISDPRGEMEKAATLKLAKALAAALAADFNMILTRNDDYKLDPDQRAGVANRARAAAFISLHAGTGKYPNRDSIVIFVRKYDTYRPGGICREAYPDAPAVWRSNQLEYQDKSMQLARILAASFERLLSPGVKVSVRRAPVMVLGGVKAPAVLVEVGMLLNTPGKEARINQRLVQALKESLKEFLHGH